MPMLAACQPNTPVGHSMNTEACYIAMQNYFNEIGGDLRRSNASNLLAYAEKCEGSGIYEVTLASVYFAHNDMSNAIATAHKGLMLSDSDKDTITHVLVRAELAVGNYEGARTAAEKLFESDSNSSMGNLLLAKYFNAVDKYSEAISRSKNAIATGGGQEAYGVLVTAYYNNNQFEESVRSYVSGLATHRELASNLDAVLAASASYYEIGNKQAARDVLDRHIELVPESSSHPLVIKMYEILAQP